MNDMNKEYKLTSLIIKEKELSKKIKKIRSKINELKKPDINKYKNKYFVYDKGYAKKYLKVLNAYYYDTLGKSIELEHIGVEINNDGKKIIFINYKSIIHTIYDLTEIHKEDFDKQYENAIKKISELKNN